MNQSRFALLYLLLICYFSVLNCVNQVAGGIGHEGEAMVIGSVRYEQSDSIPAGASVFILPEDYMCMSDCHQNNRVPVTVVDDSGHFQIDSLASGKYIIEINDGFKNAVSIRCEVSSDNYIVNLPQHIMQPTGIVCGKLSGITDTTSQMFVHVSGLERMSVVNVATDSFWLQDIPPGIYLLVVSQSATGTVSVIDSVSVILAGTTFVECKIFSDGTIRAVSKKLILNTSSSGAQISDNLYNFPVLICLNRENFDFTSAQENGNDIYFTGKGNALLPHEIEYWNSDEMDASIWVLLDTVYGNQDTQCVNIHWGQSPDAQKKYSRVFDTTSGFQGVWHFSEPQGDTLKDATVNNFYGLFQGTEDVSRVTGPAGYARIFDGVSNYVKMPTTADSKLNFPENGIFSLSAWIYMDKLDNQYHEIISKSNQLYGLQVNDSNLVEFYEYSIEDAWNSNNAPITSREWHLLTCVRDGEGQYLYIDGICVDSTTAVYGGIRRRVMTEPLCVGNRVSTSENGFFKGYIDEVRVYNKALSASWIKLNFANQCSGNNLIQFR